MMNAFVVLLMLNGGGPPDFEPPAAPTTEIVNVKTGHEAEALMIIITQPHPGNQYYLEERIKTAPMLKTAIAQKAIEMEILDPREIKYILAKDSEFFIDCNLVARRFQDLKDAPKLSDANKLPDRPWLNQCVRHNRAFHKTLNSRMMLETDRIPEFEAVIRDNQYLYQVYDAMRDSNCDFYYVTVRRHALQKLVILLGEEDYHKNYIPPCVPLWHFIDE